EAEGGEAVEDVEVRAGVVAEEAADVDEVARLDDHEGVDGLRRLLDAAGEALLQQGGEVGGGHRHPMVSDASQKRLARRFCEASLNGPRSCASRLGRCREVLVLAG